MSAARRAVVALASVSLLASGAVGARAADGPDTATACALGGPTPGARVLRLDLPHGADDVSLAMHTTTATGRRLAEGVFLLTARTHRLVAFRIAVDGVAPARTSAHAGDATIVDSAYSG